MAGKTTNYSLNTIDLTDSPPDITVLNENMEIIDNQMKENADKVSESLPKSDYTAEDILNKLKTVDGVNSGLDADLFKGNNIIPIANGGTGATTPVWSNPNSLKNGDFQVWQRGESFTASGYTADRWYAYMSGSGNSVSHANGGITIDTTSGNLIQLQQFFEEAEFKKLKGKTVTLSINIEIIQGSVAVYSNVDTFKQIGSISVSGIHKFTFTVAEDISSFKILFSFLAGRKAVIKWVKLELGEVSTPFVPRTYAEELAMCQRYYQVLNKYGEPYYELGMSAGKGDKILYLSCHLPTEMRIAPTITALGTWRVDTGNTRVANINTISATTDASKPDAVGLTVTTDNNITKDAYVTIKGYNNVNSRITLDAEIY